MCWLLIGVRVVPLSGSVAFVGDWCFCHGGLDFV